MLFFALFANYLNFYTNKPVIKDLWQHYGLENSGNQLDVFDIKVIF